MKNDKICISKAVAVFVPICLLLIAGVLFSSYLLNGYQKKSGTNVRAGGRGWGNITLLTNCYDSNDATKATGYPIGYCSPYNDGTQYICDCDPNVDTSCLPKWVPDNVFDCMGQKRNDAISTLTGNGVTDASIDKLKKQVVIGQCVAQWAKKYVEGMSTKLNKQDVVARYAAYKSCDDGTLIRSPKTACTYQGKDLQVADASSIATGIYYVDDARGCIGYNESGSNFILQFKSIGQECDITTNFLPVANENLCGTKKDTTFTTFTFNIKGTREVVSNPGIGVMLNVDSVDSYNNVHKTVNKNAVSPMSKNSYGQYEYNFSISVDKEQAWQGKFICDLVLVYNDDSRASAFTEEHKITDCTPNKIQDISIGWNGT